jgi:two-component system phosphate regulon sensor histidine kinase PhoR
MGIPAVHLPHIFERFYRVDEARNRNIGGTGLGLSIVKAIINAHQGRIHVLSTPGQGSEFIVYLPLDPAALPSAPAAVLS